MKFFFHSAVTVFLLFASHICAQDFLVSFKGAGASSVVDSVKIENLTRCLFVTIGGNDTLLLSGSSGIKENNINNNYKALIYPSPSIDNCCLELESNSRIKADIEIFDVTGRRLLKEQSLLYAGINKFNIGGLGSGIYFIRIFSNEFSYTSKILSFNTRKSIIRIYYAGTSPSDERGKFLKRNVISRKFPHGKTLIPMQYTSGEKLKLTGYSGNNYKTVCILAPESSQSVTFNFVNCTDADGNHYAVVQIGGQLWMSENLRTTKYRNNDVIPNVVSNQIWSTLNTGACCSYNNTLNPDTVYTFGRLYNWYAINDVRNLAPSGWRIASDSEWTVLSDFLGGMDLAGGKLKDKCLNFWHLPNTGATNETGFTSFPGGYRFMDGTFDEFGNWCVWWTSSSSSANGAPTRALFFDDLGLGRDISNKKDGFSIRCIKN